MAKAITQKFEEMRLEVETATPGTYARLCGIVDVEVTRTSEVERTETPDCDDESLPNHIDKAIRSQEVTVSGTGVWARTSWGTITDWWYSGQPKNVRIVNTGAAVGDTEYEAGPALLTTTGNARTKGQLVSQSITIEFVGVPTRTDQAA